KGLGGCGVAGQGLHELHGPTSGMPAVAVAERELSIEQIAADQCAIAADRRHFIDRLAVGGEHETWDARVPYHPVPNALQWILDPAHQGLPVRRDLIDARIGGSSVGFITR